MNFIKNGSIYFILILLSGCSVHTYQLKPETGPQHLFFDSRGEPYGPFYHDEQNGLNLDTLVYVSQFYRGSTVTIRLWVLNKRHNPLRLTRSSISIRIDDRPIDPDSIELRVNDLPTGKREDIQIASHGDLNSYIWISRELNLSIPIKTVDLKIDSIEDIVTHEKLPVHVRFLVTD